VTSSSQAAVEKLWDAGAVRGRPGQAGTGADHLPARPAGL